ncbi:MAG: SusC/RagA family TonB-linked outer membrane protein [Pedobacter sp.]|uniref:SusC/RagA family TonB-linked outer membrane protein n=1 Tax=Pedobacter sp. TaxID=1411316 RepID=UPI003399A925
MLNCCANPQVFAQAGLHLRGTVLSHTDGQPLKGATVKTTEGLSGVLTDERGFFSLTTAAHQGMLVISYVGYTTIQVAYNTASRGPFKISMQPNTGVLDEVTVATGFQTLPKERATGSFSLVDSTSFNRSVSSDVISRLKGVSSALLFGNVTATNGLGIAVRGKSTIWANSQPLVVLDNFPYEGDLNNINPNDVENVTVLKDAAAASIWGTRAGNGVIVITTKRGRYNQPVQVSFNSNVNTGRKPDLFYERKISAPDFISAEKFLFEKGKYNSAINDGISALTPAVEILLKARAGTITPAQSNAQLTELAKHDLRNDLLKYFYRQSVSQQYALSLRGGSDKQQYYVSGGYNKNLGQAVGNSYDRISMNASNTYSLLNHRLEISTGIIFAKSTTLNNAVSPIFGVGAIYPYATLADENGKALPIAKYRTGFPGSKANSNLLDWGYKPLDELGFADNSVNLVDYQVSLGGKYKIIGGLNAELKYRYGKGDTETNNHYSQETYYTRNLINSYTQINSATGVVTRPVPLGGILNVANGNYQSQNLRGQLNFNQNWKEKHQLNMLAGAEAGELNTLSNRYNLYGYDSLRETSLPVDFYNSYPNYITGASAVIPSGLGMGSLTNRTLSFFGNGAYTFLDRYTLSASARSDGSNLFGVKTNQKWAPLWSVGSGWALSKEDFYHSALLPYLKLRATFGYNGNIDKNVTAYLTTRITTTNRYGALYSSVLNPPNPDLTWERIGQMNFAADFGFKNNRVTGSIEYYRKNGKDLIGDALLAPTSGYASFRGNTASMKGKGLDLTLQAQALNGVFKWNTMGLFSYTKSWITDYQVMPLSNPDYISGSVPKVGRDMSGIYVYKWAGLDGQTGDPQGYLNGVVSKDYASMVRGTNPLDLEYKGPSSPPVFGSLLNSFSYKGLVLSFNLIYKLGYRFRRESMNYSSLFSGTSGTGHSDFSKRWQKAGDELITNVPSMVYPANANRDNFYLQSAALIEKGDHIRLQDVQLSYGLSKKQVPMLPFRNIQLYGYVSNLGIIWRANHAGLDPDVSAYPLPLSTALGLKIDL